MARLAAVVGGVLAVGLLAGCGAVERAVGLGEGCPGGSAETIEFIDFVRVGDETYVRAGFPGSTPTPNGTRLGEVVETVRCEFSEGAPGSGYEQRPGDAAYLDVGTQVRTVAGFDPAFRLGVEVDGEVVLYELDEPRQGRDGAAVFPGLRPHVRAVSIATWEDDDRELRRVADPQQVAALVDSLLRAPFDPGAREGATVDHYVRLLLDDGSQVVRAYDSRRGVLWPGLVLPQDLRERLLPGSAHDR